MNKLIVSIALMALTQAVMGEEKNTLEKAQEVAQQMRADANKEYAKGLAKRRELHQWADAAEAVKRIQARYDQHEGIRHKAQVEYDNYDWPYACRDSYCQDQGRAARHWQGFRDRTYPYIAIAKSYIAPSGVPIDTEVARSTQHLKWAKMEKRWADSMEHIVKTQYKTDDYIDEAELTVRTANAELIWAEESAKKARKAINALLDGTLYKARQAKYDKADDYLRRQRAVHEAEQAEIAAIEREKRLQLEREKAAREAEKAAREAEQALLDRESKFLWRMMNLLYGT